MNFITNKQANHLRLSKIIKRLKQGNNGAEKILTKEIPKKSKGFMAEGCISKFGLRKLIFFIGFADSFSYKQAFHYYSKDIEKLNPENNTLYFQQDNSSLHTSKEVKEILSRKL